MAYAYCICLYILNCFYCPLSHVSCIEGHAVLTVLYLLIPLSFDVSLLPRSCINYHQRLLKGQNKAIYFSDPNFQ